jgi:hypothetical protein
VSFIRHQKIYRHDVQGEGELKSNFPSDHRCDESSAGYSFVGCSPAAPTSASPAVNSFSLYSAAVQFSAANRNCPSIALSQPRGPLQPIPGSVIRVNFPHSTIGAYGGCRFRITLRGVGIVGRRSFLRTGTRRCIEICWLSRRARPESRCGRTVSCPITFTSFSLLRERMV